MSEEELVSYKLAQVEKKPITVRLEDLKRLKDVGLMPERDYERKKKEIWEKDYRRDFDESLIECSSKRPLNWGYR